MSNVLSSRHLQGTTHYITEYILMLASLFGLVASAILMVFSICNLLKNGEVAGLSTTSGISSVVAFVVFGLLYYCLSKRVRAEEIKTPAVVGHKARSVVFVLASLSAFGWFVGFTITSVYFLISPIAVKSASYSDNFVSVFLPAVFAAVVIALSYASVAKTATTRYVAKFSSAALLVGAILAIVTLSVSIAKKDQKPTLKQGEKCTYANYTKEKCSYNDYQDYNEETYPSSYRSSPTTDYNNYQYESQLNSIYDN